MQKSQFSLHQLTALILEQARKKGFGTKPQEINVPEKIALLHSELSEAYAAYRHKKIAGKDGFKEELADVVARVLHLCGIFEIDLEKELRKKLHSNRRRTWDWDALNEKHTTL